ncbi:hypothetical protein PYCC9005_000531 [Savitreella phatthalungensis]
MIHALATLAMTAISAQAFTIPGLPGFPSTGCAKALPSGSAAPPSRVPIYNLPGDPAYSVPEQDLLAAISFPDGYNCESQAIVLLPGTGVSTNTTYGPIRRSLKKELANSGGVSVVSVEYPDLSAGPISTSAEYAAYAINYFRYNYGVKPTVLAWSQGTLSAQWAELFWNSARASSRNLVALSADYRGTLLANLDCSTPTVFTPETAAVFLNPNNLLIAAKQFFGFSALPASPAVFKSAVANAAKAGSSSKTKRQQASDPSALAAAFSNLVNGVGTPLSQFAQSLVLDPSSFFGRVVANFQQLGTNPQNFDLNLDGCLVAVSQQQIGSKFLAALARNGGFRALLPTTSLHNAYDEVVIVNGATGEENASGHLPGANNILIQDYCPFVPTGASGQIANIEQHAWPLFQGIPVAAIVLAVKNGGAPTIDQIKAAYPPSYCATIFQDNDVADALEVESILPGALAGILFKPTPRVLVEPNPPAYAA